MRPLKSGVVQYAVLVATVVLVVAFLQTRAMDVEAHNQRLRLLLELQAADAQLDRDLLRVTSFMLLQFDPLVTNERRIHDLLGALKPAGTDRMSGTFNQDLDAYHTVLDQKLDIQERVKSQVAMVRNGLLYLPLAVAELGRTNPALGGGASEVLNELFGYNLFPTGTQAQSVETAIDALELFSEVDEVSRPAFENVLSHMRANLDLTGRLADLRREFVDAPSGARFDRLYRNYTTRYADQAKRADTYTLLLLAATLALFLALGVVLRNLHSAKLAAERAWTQLRDAVESLTEAFALFSPQGRLVLHNSRYESIYPWLKGSLRAGCTTVAEVLAAHRTSGAFLQAPALLDPRDAGQEDQGARPSEIRMEVLDGARWYRASDSVTTTGDLVCVRVDISDTKRTEQELRKLYRALEQSPASVLITDITGAIEYVNPRFEEVTGYTADEVVGRNPRLLKSGDKSTADYKELWDTILSGGVWRGQFHNRRKDGSIYWESASISPVRDDDGAITHFIAVKEDITARRRAEEQLRMNATVFDTTTEGIMVTDGSNRIKTVNPAFTRITGYQPEEVIGRNPRVLSSGRHDQAFYASLWETLQRTGYWNGEVWNRRKDGSVYPEWLSVALIRDEQGGVKEHVAVFSDISQRKSDEEQIRRQANYDALTGLPNRSLLFDRIENALKAAKRKGWQVALLFVDLDRFKGVNDSMGHVVGDELLQHVARRLTRNVRESDTVARFGGDEFVIVIEDMQRADEAAVVAETLIADIGTVFRLIGREVFVGASIGITLYPSDAKDATALLRNADMAMYRAKEAGRNTYRFYTKEMNRDVQWRMEMERELRSALDRHQLYLLYQPIVSIADARVVGAEALVRWSHPGLGEVSPEQFIPLAEETGVIADIGRWVLRESCRTLAAWRATGRDWRISVNLSSRQLALGLADEEVLGIIRGHDLPAAAVTLEITEGMMLEASDNVLHWLESVHREGVGLAVDDFGTGYSSLSYLKRFLVDGLKIDRSFVKGLPDGREDVSLVSAILSMAHSLGLRVVAEGIETPAQARMLAELGCQLGQGFLYSRPIPAEAMAAIAGPLGEARRKVLVESI